MCVSCQHHVWSLDVPVHHIVPVQMLNTLKPKSSDAIRARWFKARRACTFLSLYCWAGSERSSTSFFLRRENLDSLDCVCLQALATINALRHLPPSHILYRTFTHKRGPFLRNSIVSGFKVFFVEKLSKHLDAKAQQSVYVNLYTIWILNQKTCIETFRAGQNPWDDEFC